MKITQDYNHSFDSVKSYVWHNTQSYSDEGQIENLQAQSHKTTDMLARLLQTLFEKNVLTSQDLTIVVGGHVNHAKIEKNS